MMSLVEKLSAVMSEVGYVQKDMKNDFHHYKYASAEAVLKKVNGSLSSHGIAVSSEVNLEQIQPHGDGNLAIVKMRLTFTDGDESLSVEGLGSGYDKGDKAVLKANTAALKYAVANGFMISWGDDPEADTYTDKVVEENPLDSVVADWDAALDEAVEGDPESFLDWWSDHGGQIKDDCGKARAAEIYNRYMKVRKERS